MSSLRAHVSAIAASLGVLAISWQYGLHSVALHAGQMPEKDDADTGQTDSDHAGNFPEPGMETQSPKPGESPATQPTPTTESATPAEDLQPSVEPDDDPTGSDTATTKPSSDPTTARPGPTTAPTSSRPTPSIQTQALTGKFEGNPVAYRYGTVRVSLMFQQGRIIDVITTEDADGETSQSIQRRAIPVLKQGVLEAQNANIASVSGATYTVSAFKTSLQTALNRAYA